MIRIRTPFMDKQRVLRARHPRSRRREAQWRVELDGGLHWDFDVLFEEVLTGLAAAASDGRITSIGIDIWAVDCGLGRIDGRVSLYAEPAVVGEIKKDDGPWTVGELAPKVPSSLLVDIAWSALSTNWNDRRRIVRDSGPKVWAPQTTWTGCASLRR